MDSGQAIGMYMKCYNAIPNCTCRENVLPSQVVNEIKAQVEKAEKYDELLRLARRMAKFILGKTSDSFLDGDSGQIAQLASEYEAEKGMVKL